MDTPENFPKNWYYRTNEEGEREYGWWPGPQKEVIWATKGNRIHPDLKAHVEGQKIAKKLAEVGFRR